MISRSRKAFAFFSETGKAGTEMVYTDCLENFKQKPTCAPIPSILWDFFFINFLR